MGESHIAVGDLARERNLGKSWEVAFDLVQLKVRSGLSSG